MDFGQTCPVLELFEIDGIGGAIIVDGMCYSGETIRTRLHTEGWREGMTTVGSYSKEEGRKPIRNGC